MLLLFLAQYEITNFHFTFAPRIMPISVKHASISLRGLRQLASRKSSSAKVSIGSFAATVCRPGTLTIK